MRYLNKGTIGNWDNITTGTTLNARLDNLTFKKLTQAEYDALTKKDPNTIYFTT